MAAEGLPCRVIDRNRCPLSKGADLVPAGRWPSSGRQAEWAGVLRGVALVVTSLKRLARFPPRRPIHRTGDQPKECAAEVPVDVRGQVTHRCPRKSSRLLRGASTTCRR